ncbi:MAG TPA: DUF4129 domain-containing protein [Steroidobacter sp.]|uniref:DUF4129 domain-containing protein n=1 Tax=Steroidobacter sp. TaxID=1978227 RepID=UPI002ED807FC
MRSRIRAIGLALALAWITCAFAALVLPSPAIAALEETEILDALDKVSEDPNLSPERKIRTLRWLDDRKQSERRKSGWISWLEGLFQWIGGASRLLLWIAIVILVALLAVFLKRVFSGISYTPQAQTPQAPTHVQEMDIRPESLPDDIGGAALRLWEQNEHRAALALLYRGLLSRLVHSHAVPIRESTTEADCLTLAAPRLRADITEYTTQLVRVWQHAVYGARKPAESEVRALCVGFNRNFPLAAQPAEGAS